MKALVWNEGNIGGTCFVGFAPMPHGFDAAVARLKSLGAEDDGPGDKTTVEFRGTFKGAVFSLYDYYEDDRLHIGGFREDSAWGEGPALDVLGLKQALVELLR